MTTGDFDGVGRRRRPPSDFTSGDEEVRRSMTKLWRLAVSFNMLSMNWRTDGQKSGQKDCRNWRNGWLQYEVNKCSCPRSSSNDQGRGWML